MRSRRGVTFAASPVFLSQGWGDNVRGLMQPLPVTKGRKIILRRMRRLRFYSRFVRVERKKLRVTFIP